MTDGSARPRRGRPPKADTAERVLAATRQIEAELGYDATSIEAIAELAGVAKTSIYRRWPNKGALMYEAVIATDAEFAEIADTGDIHHDLLVVLLENAHGTRDPRYRQLLGSLLAEAMTDDALAASLREGFFGPRADAIARRVATAVDRGELLPTIDAELVPALLTGPLQYLWLVRGSDLAETDLRRLLDAVLTPHLAAR